MAKQFGNVWLSRDKGKGKHDNLYVLTKRRPELREVDDRTVREWDADVYFTPEFFQSLTKTRLKPGEGPMRAKISIEI